MLWSMSDDMRPDIAAAWAKASSKFGKKRGIRKLPEYLNAGEAVLAIAGGMVSSKNGLLVATDRRAMFMVEDLFNHSFEDFAYDRITTVNSSSGPLFGKIIIHTAGAARVIEQVAKGEAEAVAAIIRERVEAITRERHYPWATSPVEPHASEPLNLVAELRELAQLRDQGILTPEEFDVQKARLLGNIR